MSRYPDDELERLLRGALEETARRVEPAGDGLVRIRERVQGRQRWTRFLAPTLALAGAAAVIIGIVLAPTYLTGSRTVPGLVGAGGQPAQLSDSPSTPSGATATPSTGPSPTGSGPWGTPIAGNVDLPDRTAVWPYSSRKAGYERADADVASGKYPNLADAGRTAVDFVASFVGPDQKLSATRLGPSGPGVQMVVQRTDADGRTVPVSNVFLVRVRKADDAPYVVLGASRAGLGDSLSLFPVPALAGTETFEVTGNVRRPAGAADPTVRLALREPGSTEDLGLGSAAVRLAGAPVRTWRAEFAPLRSLPGTGVVAAWTLDDQGRVAEFVAAPTGS